MNGRFTKCNRNVVHGRRVHIAYRCEGFDAVTDHIKDDSAVPPPVISAAPEKELEQKLKRHPGDLDTKADVGSDESMDASDPSAAAQPGCDNEPAPSSGFPE